MPVFSFPYYYPDTGTGSDSVNRTYVGPFGQPVSKQTSQRLTLLHSCALAESDRSEEDEPQHARCSHGFLSLDSLTAPAMDARADV